MSKSINLSPNNIMTYSWGIEVGGIQLIGAGVPMEKNFEENLVNHCLSNTWCLHYYLLQTQFLFPSQFQQKYLSQILMRTHYGCSHEVQYNYSLLPCFLKMWLPNSRLESYVQRFEKPTKQTEHDLQCFQARYFTRSNINS